LRTLYVRIPEDVTLHQSESEDATMERVPLRKASKIPVNLSKIGIDPISPFELKAYSYLPGRPYPLSLHWKKCGCLPFAIALEPTDWNEP
jgi:hypothetical protein